MVNMRKGDAPISMRKTATITATASWSSSTDYDLYALVVHRTGVVVHIANFGAQGEPAKSSYRGIGLGKDAGRAAGSSGTALETLTIGFDDSIAAVIPVAYSAQSNGSGSFRRYKVWRCRSTTAPVSRCRSRPTTPTRTTLSTRACPRSFTTVPTGTCGSSTSSSTRSAARRTGPPRCSTRTGRSRCAWMPAPGTTTSEDPR